MKMERVAQRRNVLVM